MDESGSTKHGRRHLLTPGRKAEHAAAKGDDPLREVRRSIHEGEAAWPKGGLGSAPARLGSGLLWAARYGSSRVGSLLTRQARSRRPICASHIGGPRCPATWTRCRGWCRRGVHTRTRHALPQPTRHAQPGTRIPRPHACTATPHPAHPTNPSPNGLTRTRSLTLTRRSSRWRTRGGSPSTRRAACPTGTAGGSPTPTPTPTLPLPLPLPLTTYSSPKPTPNQPRSPACPTGALVRGRLRVRVEALPYPYPYPYPYPPLPLTLTLTLSITLPLPLPYPCPCP